MSLGLPQLERHLAQGPLAPVYLLAGDEDLLRIEAADAVRAAAKAQGYAEREIHDVDAKFDWNLIEAGFVSLSLFSSRRLIDLRLPTGKPGKDGAAVIEKFCADPPPDLCLLITAGEWSRKHEAGWSRAIDKAGVFVPIAALKPADLPGWIARRLKSRGVEVDPAAVRVLLDRIEGNLLAAAQEVDKLALLARGQRLDAVAMQDLVADSARFNVFAMVEAAVNGDAARALRMLRGLRSEGEGIVPLMNVVAGQVQVLAQMAEAEATGGSVARVMQEAGVWESRQPACRKALARTGNRGCARLLAACAELDRASKGRSDQDPWVLMERILTAMATPRALGWLEVA